MGAPVSRETVYQFAAARPCALAQEVCQGNEPRHRGETCAALRDVQSRVPGHVSGAPRIERYAEIAVQGLEWSALVAVGGWEDEVADHRERG